MPVDRREFLGLATVGTLSFISHSANAQNESENQELLVGQEIAAQPGNEIEVPFEITNITDDYLNSVEIAVNTYYIRDLNASEENGWHFFEGLTLWETPSSLSPGASITALLPVDVAEDAHGAYAIQARTRNMDLEATATAKVHVPPLPNGPSLDLTVVGGRLPNEMISYASAFERVSEEPVCPEETAAIGFYLRNAGTDESNTPLIRPTIPDEWTVSRVTDTDYWEDSEYQWQLPALYSGEFSIQRIDLTPEPDVTDQSIHELEQTAIGEDSSSTAENATIEIDPSVCSPSSESTHIDAEITSFDTNGGTVKPGDVVESMVTVENTGDVEHTFFVGYSMIGPDGTEYHNDGTTGRQITFSPGEQRAIDLTWNVTSSVPPGLYTAICIVWEESDRSTLETELATAENEDVVTVTEGDTNLEIISFETPNETIEPGDEAQSTVIIQNHDSVDHTRFVGYSVIAPDNRPFSNNGTTGKTVTIPANETIPVDLSWTAVSAAPIGPYEVITIVWEEQDRNDLDTPLDRAREEEAFQLVNGAYPAGTSIFPPSQPTEFPFTHTQEIVVDDDEDDVEPIEGKGMYYHVNRERLSEDQYKLTIHIEDPEESILSYIGGHQASQILVLFNNQHLDLMKEDVASQVNGGKTRAIVAGEFVSEVQSLAEATAKLNVVEFINIAVENLSEEARTERDHTAATSYIQYNVPPEIDAADETSVMEIDFSSSTAGNFATAPITIHSYTLEAYFEISDNAEFDETTISVIADMRGSSPYLEELAHEDIAEGRDPTSAELPVEYRHPVHVSLTKDDTVPVTEETETPPSSDNPSASSPEQSAQERSEQNSSESGGTEGLMAWDAVTGFGVVSTLAGAGGVTAYALKRLRSSNGD